SRRRRNRRRVTTHDHAAPAGRGTARRRFRPGDVVFQGLALAAAVGAAALLALIAYKVVQQAWPAMRHFGVDFLWSNVWNPNSGVFGAASFIFGTVVTSFVALLVATPL